MLPDDPGLGQPGWGLQLLGAVAPTALSPQRATVAVAAAAKGSRYAPWQQRADSSAPCTPNGRTFQAEPPWAPQHLSLGWGHPTVVSPPPPQGPRVAGGPCPTPAPGPLLAATCPWSIRRRAHDYQRRLLEAETNRKSFSQRSL